LLKRYKLTPEKFRQLFFRHTKGTDATWYDFAYEVRNYFEQWIGGLKIETFENLCDLIITEQIKRKVPAEIKEHFIDQWSQFKTPEEIVDKLEDYENVRLTINMKQDSFVQRGNAVWKKHYYENNQKELLENTTEYQYVPPPYIEQRSESKSADIVNTRKSKFECYVCGMSHLARECPERFEKKAAKFSENFKNEDVLTAEIQSVLLENNKARIVVNPLQYIDVLVENQEIKALIDSGSQIPVINAKCISKPITEIGRITLTSVFGEKIEAALANLQVAWKDKDHEKLSKPIEILFAVTDRINGQCVIPQNIYNLWISDSSRKRNKEMECRIVPYRNEPIRGKERDFRKNIEIRDVADVREIREIRINKDAGGTRDRPSGEVKSKDDRYFLQEKKMEWRKKRFHFIEKQREQDKEKADRPWPRRENNRTACLNLKGVFTARKGNKSKEILRYSKEHNDKSTLNESNMLFKNYIKYN